MTASDAQDDLVGQLLESRYRILQLLGKGGMGEVYLADDERFDGSRRVVVKFPKAALLAADEEFRDRFEREIKSLARLQLSGVVRILDHGRHGPLPFFVIEFLAGGDLGHRLTRAQSPEEVIRWLAPVARILDRIHQRNIIHRDIKPGNILFDEDGEVVVGDFGIAKAVGAEDTGLTLTGQTPGTPRYMAPEAGSDDPLGPRYDQYALGVMVYEALTHSTLHEGSSALVILTKRREKPAPSLLELRPELPESLAQVIARCLKRRPGDRYGTCTAFADAFATALSRPGDATEDPDATVVHTAPIRRRAKASTPRRRPSPFVIPAVVGALLGVSVLAWMWGPEPEPERPSVGAAESVSMEEPGPAEGAAKGSDITTDQARAESTGDETESGGEPVDEAVDGAVEGSSEDDEARSRNPRTDGTEDPADDAALEANPSTSAGTSERGDPGHEAASAVEAAARDEEDGEQAEASSHDPAEERVEELLALKEEDPENVATRLTLASTFRSMAEHERALAELDEAHELDPDNSAILVTRATVRRALKDFDLALADAERAMAITDDYDTRNSRGLCRMLLGDYSGAIRDFEMAGIKAPDAYNKAGMVENIGLVHLHQGQWDAALRHTQEVDRIREGMAWNVAIRYVAAVRLERDAIAAEAWKQWKEIATPEESATLEEHLPARLVQYLHRE